SALRDDVWQQLALDLRDLVFEQQLALLEPLQSQLIERPGLGNARNHVVKVAVLDLQSRKFGLQGFDVEIHRQSARGSRIVKAAAPAAMPSFPYSMNRASFIGRR